jgi:hypothetical protein
MWNTPKKEKLDTIPRLFETEHISLKEKTIYLHFFIGSCDWFVCEFDGQDKFFGFVCLNGDLEMAEWGYFSFQELQSIRIGMGIEIDCDPKPAKKIALICKAQRWPMPIEKRVCKNV